MPRSMTRNCLEQMISRTIDVAKGGCNEGDKKEVVKAQRILD